MHATDDELAELPEVGGVYLLVFHLDGVTHLVVGALGELVLRAGYYAYAGSARQGLRSRLRHHLTAGGKRRHWHVDYLRQVAEPLYALVWRGNNADECSLSRAAARVAAETVKDFGSSDCRCGGHLHYFREDPRELLRGLRGFPLELIRL